MSKCHVQHPPLFMCTQVMKVQVPRNTYTYLALIVHDAPKGTIKKRFIHRDFFTNQLLKESRPDIPRFFKDSVSNSQIFSRQTVRIIWCGEKQLPVSYTVVVETPVYQL
jgi:hypothetical protein